MPENYKLVEDRRTMIANRANIFKDYKKRSFVGKGRVDSV
jgi:hypothetical protein